MINSLRTLLAGTSSLVLCLSLQAVPVVGQPAPEFSLTDIAGQTHTLSAYKGRVVVLEWVNPECPVVGKHYQGSGNMPATQQVALADGAVWLSINSGHPGAQGDYDAAEVAAWLKQTGARPAAYCRDQNGKVGKLYGARHTPTLYVINAEGTLVYHGGIDDINSSNPADVAKATNFVKAALADLKAGRPVARPTSRPYGCNVKY